MPIYVNGAEPATLPGVEAVYVNAEKVWPTLPPLPIPLASWNFDDTPEDVAARIARDSSGNGRDAANFATTQRPTPGYQSAYGGNLGGRLAGANSTDDSGVDIVPFNAATNRTMTFWCSLAAAGGSTYHVAGLLGTPTGSQKVWALTFGRNRYPEYSRLCFSYRIDGATTSPDVPFGTTPTAGVWNHYALVLDAALSETRVYVNGELQHTEALAGPIHPGAGRLEVGQGSTRTGDVIDRLRYYDVILTPEDIAVDMLTP